MGPKELTALSDEELIAFCVEPLIRDARGKDPETKARVLASLSSGQRALFMFQVLHGHADRGVLQFFRQISYLTEALDVWAALKSAMEYFKDTEMLELISKMESAFPEAASGERAGLDALDRAYAEQISKTVRRIGSRIRMDPAAFLKPEN
jgi:hypothetical protein